MESPISFDGTVSGDIGSTANQPWVAANPPLSSFGNYPARPRAGYFFQSVEFLFYEMPRA